MVEKRDPETQEYTFTALEFVNIRDAIGDWPQQTKAMSRYVDDLEDIFTMNGEEKERCGYILVPPGWRQTPKGWRENWAIKAIDVSFTRRLDTEQVNRLIRLLTAADIHDWARAHYRLAIKPIVDRLGGEPVEL